MPYDSNAQRKYFHAALARGEIKPSVVHEFDQASKGLKLPERKMAEGGPVTCPACGYAFGGMVGEEQELGFPSNLDETAADPDEERRRYISLIQRGGY